MADFLTKIAEQENRRKWFIALRSGEYKQTTGTLRGCNGSFCCLGVAEKIFFGDEPAADRYGRICSAIGVEDPGKIWRLNDRDHLTFPQIADELENNPTDYFEV